MESADTVVVGIVLLLIVPLLFVEALAAKRGGYNAAFWKLPLDEKLDHIAREPGHFTRIGVVWLPNLALAAAGMTAFTYQLASVGAGTLAYLALGAFLFGVMAWLVGALLQTSAVRKAAEVRNDTGETPDWLDAFWNVGWWAEIAYVTVANLAFIGWGIAILDTGFPADWMGWTAIALGGIALALIVSTKEGFPHLGITVPVVLGVALVIY